MSWRRWYQDGIDLKGTKKRAEEAATVLDSESESEPELESDSELELESDLELNADPGREEESRRASGSSGVEWSGAEE